MTDDEVPTPPSGAVGQRGPEMVVTRDRVESRLAQHGYRVVRHTGEHTLYEHHGDQIVVPVHSGALSPWSARVIEWSLEPRLGPGWLTGPPMAGSSDARSEADQRSKPVRLHLVVRPEPDRSAWNAFVVEEPRILTFGPTLREVRRNAADAAATWFAQDASVELVPQLQLDAESNRWLDQAVGAGPSSSGSAEARQELGRLGFDPDDVDALIDWDR